MFIRDKLGDLLVEDKKITAEQLSRLLEIQNRKGDKLETIIVEEGILDEETILDTMEKQLGIPRVEFSSIYLQETAIRSIPYLLGKKHCAVPIYFKDDNVLVTAMNDPLDILALDDLGLVTGKNIVPVIAKKEEINDILMRYFDDQIAKEATLELREGMSSDEFDNLNKDKEIATEVNNAPIVRLVNSIIEQGVRKEASDIHIEPFSDRVRIRVRIDGILHEMMRVDVNIHNAIVSRIKIMSNLNIAETRLPQDGSIAYDMDDRIVDIRISIVPTILGEKLVLRILDSKRLILKTENLGFTPDELTIVETMIKTSGGIILVTGPTGSGKTSTLYTLLRSLNRESHNIITVEDPIEFKLDGINQVQVSQKIGLNFINALRSILRQDPDIIMIGEIRDLETAEIAIRASITGHLVFSTLHTNDAVSTIDRLIDMGVPSYLLSASLTGIISQRLVRKICNNCKASYLAKTYEKNLLEANEENLILYRGQGCSVCNHTGYKGRTAIHEVLYISKELRNLIFHNQGAEKIKALSIKEGMIPLHINAMSLVRDGITTLDEIIKVTYYDE